MLLPEHALFSVGKYLCEVNGRDKITHGRCSNVFIKGYVIEVCKEAAQRENNCLVPSVKTLERRLQIIVPFGAIPNDQEHSNVLGT